MTHLKPKFRNRTKAFILAFGLIGGAFFFNACNNGDNPQPDNPPALASTPLYDTLGWFIQGGHGKIEGRGTEMIADPDNPGQKIQAGRLAIRTVVNKALGIIAADTALAKYFPVLLAEVGAGNTTGLAHLSKNFTDFVQQGVSGQKVYTGKSMVEAHNHATYNRFGSDAHPVSNDADFNQFMSDIVTAAQSLNVPNSVIAQLGAILATVKGDVTQG